MADHPVGRAMDWVGQRLLWAYLVAGLVACIATPALVIVSIGTY